MHERFPAAEFDEFMARTMEQWRVPAVAVAVVKDGETILCAGYGRRDVARDLPATADTLFPIASCTKAFTAMCAALLVDEGRLEWDRPVRQYLPAFQLRDPHAAELLTVRDLLCHRSGMPRHDLMWYGADWARKEAVERLQYLDFNRSLRSTWQYNNLMYMTAGYLVGELDHTTWEEVVRRRILGPLGMSRTNTSTAVSQADPDHARPYIYRKGELQEMPFYEADERTATGPAGTINSCVADMARWLAVQLSGQWDGRPFVSPQNLAEMHKPHMFIDEPQARQRLGFEFFSYGLGWSLYMYKGQLVIEHSGGIDGFSSRVALLPRHNLGVVVLSNGDGYHNAVADLLPLTLYDRLAGLEPTDWNARYREWQEEFEQGEARAQEQSAGQRRTAPPAHPLDDYLGDYEHPGYGIYTVRRQGEGMELVTNDKLVLPLTHYHYEVFEAAVKQWDLRLKLNFSTDLRGSVAGFSVQLEPLTPDIVFTRRPDRRLSDPAFLGQFTGEYDLLGMAYSVTLCEGRLVLRTMMRQYGLLPYQGTEFKLEGLEGCSVEFRLDEQGVCSEAVFTQPGAVHTAARKGTTC